MNMSKLQFWIRLIIIFFALLLSIVVARWFKYVPLIKTGENQITINKGSQVRLIVVGDTGTGTKNQYIVAKAMEKFCLKTPDLDGIVLLGDNVYKDGVQSTSDEQWINKVEKPYGSECLKKIPIYPVLGNHDYRGNPGVQVEYSLKNPMWKMPYRFYSIDFDPLLKSVFFDSSFPDYCFVSDLCSVNFLERELLEAKNKWRITFAHHPLASASKHGYGHSGGIFGFFMKPLFCEKTDFWISGHSHHMEHRVEEGCEADLFVVGSGGADLYDFYEDQEEVKFAAKKFGFMDLLVEPNTVTIRFIGLSGEELYKVNRNKKY